MIHDSSSVMRRIHALCVCTLVMLACSATLTAQGGSNYSVFGLGDMRRSVGAAYEGMGGCITSVPLDNTINLGNPALWTLVKTTRLQGGYRFNQQRVTQGDASVGQNNGKLDGASVIFALDTSEGVSACIGVFPSSSVNYLFTKSVSISLPDSGQYIRGTSTYAGSGGMVTGYVGGAWNVTSTIAVGASGLFHFGRINDKIETSIFSQDALTSYVSNSDELSAMGLTLGIQTQPFRDFTFGASFTTNGRLRVASDINYQTAQSGALVTYDSTLTRSSSSSMPTILAAGCSYMMDRLLMAADLEYQDMSAMSYRIQTSSAAANATRVGVGFTRLGTRSAGASYAERMNISAGLGMKSLQYSFNGTQVREQYATVGVQMPFGGAAMVDASLVLGSRGSNDNGLVREMFARLCVNISVGEVWFVPFRREQ